MKTIRLALSILSSLVLVNGRAEAGAGRRIHCYYGAIANEQGQVLLPEDVDATLCTHLSYVSGGNIDADGAYVSEEADLFGDDGEGVYNRTTNLKERNPQLKVLLHVNLESSEKKIPRTRTERTNFIESIVTTLQSHGFDGLEVGWVKPGYKKVSFFGALLSGLRTEFDKHGFLLTTFLPETEDSVHVDRDIEVINRSCDYISVRSLNYWNYESGDTGLHATLQNVRSNANIYLSKGVPADKLLITVPTYGMAVQLRNINDTNIGARAREPEGVILFDIENIISYGQLLARFKNQSEEWRMYRDEESNAPYAINKNGLWISYDDQTSIANKSQYVVENNLGGVAILMLDMDDFMELGEEGPYPLTKKIREIIH